MKTRRTLAILAVTIVAAALGAVPASATGGLTLVTCNGTRDITYAPGLRTDPEPHDITINTLYLTCVDLGGAVHSGSLETKEFSKVEAAPPCCSNPTAQQST